MMYSVADLQNMGIMDFNFPYPLAFCSCFNIAIMIVNLLVLVALVWSVIYIVKWIYKLF